MTISDTNIYFSSTGNGVTTAFPMTNCVVFENTHVVVKVDGVTKALSTDYTVSNLGSSTGATVDFLTAPANGTVVERYRSVPYEQQTDLENFDGQPADVLEERLDLTVMQTQQLGNIASRSIKFPIGESLTTELPVAATRANTFLYFDASGNATTGTALSSTTVSSPMIPVVTASSLANARTALEVYSTSEVYAKTETYAKAELGAVLLTTATASNSAFIVFSLPSEWDTFLITIEGMSFATPSYLRGTFSSDGGSTYITSATYFHGGRGLTLGGSAATYSEASQTSFRSSAYNVTSNFNTLVSLSRTGSLKTTFRMTSEYLSGTDKVADYCTVYSDNAAPHTNIKFNAGTGNISTGKFSIFGLRRAT